MHFFVLRKENERTASLIWEVEDLNILGVARLWEALSVSMRKPLCLFLWKLFCLFLWKLLCVFPARLVWSQIYETGAAVWNICSSQCRGSQRWQVGLKSKRWQVIFILDGKIKNSVYGPASCPHPAPRFSTIKHGSVSFPFHQPNHHVAEFFLPPKSC